jgi:DNA-binding transcriptional LysR family regulator
MMDIKTEDLRAFLVIYEAQSMSAGARALGCTQSAASQKISRLEELLQASLFVRGPKGLSLTASGERLVGYAKESLERQLNFLDNFNQFDSELKGVLRIAGFSSVLRSLVLPRLLPLMKAHDKVNLQFTTFDVFEMESILKMNQADIIITDYFPNLNNVESIQIGEEEYVIIESAKVKDVPHVFLDHGPKDNATATYFDFIGKKKEYQRAYMGDVYSILDAVSMGVGKAVMSKHLVENDKRFKVSIAKRRYLRPIVISFAKQGYYGRLHERVLEELSDI